MEFVLFLFWLSFVGAAYDITRALREIATAIREKG